MLNKVTQPIKYVVFFNLPAGKMGALQVWQKQCITESLTNPINILGRLAWTSKEECNWPNKSMNGYRVLKSLQLSNKIPKNHCQFWNLSRLNAAAVLNNCNNPGFKSLFGGYESVWRTTNQTPFLRLWLWSADRTVWKNTRLPISRAGRFTHGDCGATTMQERQKREYPKMVSERDHTLTYESQSQTRDADTKTRCIFLGNVSFFGTTLGWVCR